MTTQKMDDLAQTWCEMWNEDPALARRLVTEDFRVWFGSTANGDDLRGPGGLERFVARSRAERGVRFTPRVVLADDGGERFAYSWDAVPRRRGAHRSRRLHPPGRADRRELVGGGRPAQHLRAQHPGAQHPGAAARRRAGIDLFQYDAGRIAQAWSWTGGRPFTF